MSGCYQKIGVYFKDAIEQFRIDTPDDLHWNLPLMGSVNGQPKQSRVYGADTGTSHGLPSPCSNGQRSSSTCFNTEFDSPKA